LQSAAQRAFELGSVAGINHTGVVEIDNSECSNMSQIKMIAIDYSKVSIEVEKFGNQVQMGV
jgi:hypothetical protein